MLGILSTQEIKQSITKQRRGARFGSSSGVILVRSDFLVGNMPAIIAGWWF